MAQKETLILRLTNTKFKRELDSTIKKVDKLDKTFMTMTKRMKQFDSTGNNVANKFKNINSQIVIMTSKMSNATKQSDSLNRSLNTKIRSRTPARIRRGAAGGIGGSGGGGGIGGSGGGIGGSGVSDALAVSYGAHIGARSGVRGGVRKAGRAWGLQQGAAGVSQWDYLSARLPTSSRKSMISHNKEARKVLKSVTDKETLEMLQRDRPGQWKRMNTPFDKLSPLKKQVDLRNLQNDYERVYTQELGHRQTKFGKLSMEPPKPKFLDKKHFGKQVKSRFTTAHDKIANMGMAGFGTAIVAATLAVKGFKFAVNAANERETSLTKAKAVIKATKGAAGVTIEDMQQKASEVSSKTGFSRNEVLEAQALLATFTQIKGVRFNETIDSMLDMQATFGGSAKENVIRLGKAINDPIAGLSSLKDMGISFSNVQRNSIKTFMEQNDIMSAQKVILTELQAEFGGMAKAQGDTGAAATKKLTNGYTDLAVAMGNVINASKNMKNLKSGVGGGMSVMAKNIEADTGFYIKDLFDFGKRASDIRNKNISMENQRKDLQTKIKNRGGKSVPFGAQPLRKLGIDKPEAIQPLVVDVVNTISKKQPVTINVKDLKIKKGTTFKEVAGRRLDMVNIPSALERGSSGAVQARLRTADSPVIIAKQTLKILERIEKNTKNTKLAAANFNSGDSF